jgi:hypothetical protein
MDAVLFRVGEETVAVPLQSVLEVLALGPITATPTAPPAIAGAVNVRGNVVAVIDLGALFGKPLLLRASLKTGLLLQGTACQIILGVTHFWEDAVLEPLAPEAAHTMENSWRRYRGSCGPVILIEPNLLIERLHQLIHQHRSFALAEPLRANVSTLEDPPTHPSVVEPNS